MEGRRLAVREKSRKSLIAFERRIKCLRESPIFQRERKEDVEREKKTRQCKGTKTPQYEIVVGQSMSV